MAHKIAFMNYKGGVGKTVTAVNLAATWAANKKNVLFVDMDPQGNGSAYLYKSHMYRVEDPGDTDDDNLHIGAYLRRDELEGKPVTLSDVSHVYQYLQELKKVPADVKESELLRQTETDEETQEEIVRTYRWITVPNFHVIPAYESLSYTHLRAHETGRNLVCRLLLEKKK